MTISRLYTAFQTTLHKNSVKYNSKTSIPVINRLAVCLSRGKIGSSDCPSEPMTEQRAISNRWSSIKRIKVSYIWGWSQSSLSTKAIYSPLANKSPLFRAPLKPSFSWWTAMIRSSTFVYSSQIAPQSSGEPSSTKMICKFLYV